jgi:hypothetical protein
MNEPVPLLVKNEQLAQWAVDCWLKAYHEKWLWPMDLWGGPVAALLIDHHQLKRRKTPEKIGCFLLPNGEQHLEAYSFWSIIRDWGLCARTPNSRPQDRPVGELLLNFPLSLSTLFEVEMAFDEALPDNPLYRGKIGEIVFEPHKVVVRLQAALDALCKKLALPETLTLSLHDRLRAGLPS